MSPHRLETFADGVFAIAATLLILNVDAQVPATPATSAPASCTSGRRTSAYAVSFVTIGIMWVNHHTVMSQIDRTDRRFLFANIGLLMCIAFVPFPTRLVAEHIRGDGARDAALAYGFTMVTTAIMFNITWLYASRGGRLLRPDANPAVVSGLTRSYLPGPWIYLGATLLAFVSPAASVIGFLVIATLYVVESSLLGNAD